jgi:hypothetical protein
VQVASAQEMEEKIDVEIKQLQATLANIEEARPFEDLTVRPRLSICILFTSLVISQVYDVGDAHPRLVQVMETMMKKGKFTVPGQPLFLDRYHAASHTAAEQVTLRNSETSTSSSYCTCRRIEITGAAMNSKDTFSQWTSAHLRKCCRLSNLRTSQ